MDIGERIKKYREKSNLSQEELAEMIFITRQTLSNWENIKSISILSNIFDVTLDDLIKGDIENMKKIVEKQELKRFKSLANIFSFEMILMLLSAYPLCRFLKFKGFIIRILITSITLMTAFSLERMKKNYDIQTYKEIIAFCENRNLTRDEKNIEYGKRTYQKIFLALTWAIISLIIMLIMNLFFK